MAILQSETSLTTDQYNDLMDITADIKRQVVAYRQNPNFSTYVGRIARSVAFPFTVDADSSLVVRAFNNAGSVYAESISNASPVWSSATLVSASGQADIQPKVVSDGAGGWDLYLLKTDGKIYKFHSADGATWNAGTAFSTVTFTASAITWLSFAGGAIPLAYVVKTDASGAYNLIAVGATAQYDTGIYWSDTISGFDAINFTAVADDTTGAHTNTNLRHCLVITGLLPNTYTFKTVSGTPVKEAQPAGGTLSFVVRPPNGSRAIQVSRWYPVQVIDQWHDSTTDRTGVKLTSSSSVLDGTNSRDTLWATVYGSEGDYNGSDTSYAYQIIAYYSSRDGKHWTQERIIPLDTTLGLSPGDFVYGASLVVHDDYAWLLSSNAVLTAKGCLDFNNPHDTLTLDLTSYITDYASGFNDARQSEFVLDNRDGSLWSTFLGDPGIITLVTKFGQGTNLVQVSIEEVDSITPHRERPREYIQVQTRDRLSWITDRVENANAIQWDNQLASLDTFADQGGIENSGLAHSDVVKGSASTGLETNALSMLSKYRETIVFHTVGAGRVADGHGGSIFVIPKPTDFGGTNASDSPTYAGVVFRAQDKDNLWACWYNYWTGKIELVERKIGVNTIHVSYTPAGAFTTRANANNSVGIRVEFKGARIQVYESTVLYSNVGARYNPGFTHYVTPSATNFGQGYVGIIGCGYSDSDQGETSAPDPIIITATPSSWGTMDSFNPTRYYAYTRTGLFYYGAGSVGAPSWTNIGPSGGVLSALLGGSAPSALYTGGGYSAYCSYFIFDPYHLRRAILLGPGGIAINDDVQSSTWAMMSHVPDSKHWWSLGASTVQGSLTASINWEGYFCWLDYAYGSPMPADTNNYFYYTYDNFATVHRTAIAGTPQCITIGQYATSWTNINVFVSRYDGVIMRSTNGGQTFSVYSYPSPTNSIAGLWGGGINLPYMLPGGTPNTSNLSLLAAWPEYTPGWERVDTAGAKHITTSSGLGASYDTPHSIATLTIDSNYVTYRGDSQHIFVSQDGGATGVVRSLSIDTSGPPRVTNIGGWPTNPNFCVLAGSANTLATFDAGVTWSGLGLGGTIHVVADLTERYDIGGVH